MSGIADGTCYVFPKLDGTNASVWFDAEDAAVRCGSRNHRLTLEGDNAGFCAWVNQSESLTMARFVDLFCEHPEWTLYGEWLVPHTLKTYREDAWRRFWIFDVYDRGQQRYVPWDEYGPDLMARGFDVIPPLAIVINPLVQDLRKISDTNTFLIQDGAGIGEGIVIKNYNYRNVYGRQTWAKIVRAEFKDQFHAACAGGTGPGGVAVRMGSFDIERTIAEKYVSDTLAQKTFAKILLDNEIENWQTVPRRELGKRVIPRLLETVWDELIREELWDAIKEHKEPTIDFKRLKRHAMAATKRHLPGLFGNEVQPIADVSGVPGA